MYPDKEVTNELWMILLIILVIMAIALIVLYFLGKKAQKKQEEQQAQIEASKQTVLYHALSHISLYIDFICLKFT